MRILAIILFVGLLQSAYGQSKNFIDENYIEVIGVAEAEFLPDVAYIGITINERDSKNKKSVEELEVSLLQVLEKYHIDPKENLLIDNMSSQFASYFFKGKQILKSKNYDLRIDSIFIVGQLITDLERVGISNVYIAKTEYSKMEEAQDSVRMAAMKHSQQLARKLANSVDQEIGRAIHVRELNAVTGGDYRYREELLENDRMMKQESFRSAPLNVKAIEVKAQVQVKYQLQ